MAQDGLEMVFLGLRLFRVLVFEESLEFRVYKLETFSGRSLLTY